MRCDRVWTGELLSCLQSVIHVLTQLLRSDYVRSHQPVPSLTSFTRQISRHIAWKPQPDTVQLRCQQQSWKANCRESQPGEVQMQFSKSSVTSLPFSMPSDWFDRSESLAVAGCIRIPLALWAHNYTPKSKLFPSM